MAFVKDPGPQKQLNFTHPFLYPLLPMQDAPLTDNGRQIMAASPKCPEFKKSGYGPTLLMGLSVKQ